MRISVELFGLAKQIVGEKKVKINLQNKNTLKDLSQELTKKYPKLLGKVIKEKTFKTIPPYMFNLDGKHTITDLNFKLQEDNKLLLLFVTIGG
ncbi:unnamed protein product [marine sediment metagenome]|uniref:ThiS family protein n=1 Tax=marine sediment metagenome TaxID=412755 RepID=X1BI88_9ZZZZ